MGTPVPNIIRIELFSETLLFFCQFNLCHTLSRKRKKTVFANALSSKGLKEYCGLRKASSHFFGNLLSERDKKSNIAKKCVVGICCAPYQKMGHHIPE